MVTATDVFTWDDYRIEIIQESGGKLLTMGVLNDAKLFSYPVSLYGRGDKVGSLSLHILSDNASLITAEAMTFLKVVRRGTVVRSFIIGNEDWGVDAKRYYLDEYIKLQIEPIEKVLGFAVCQPSGAEGTFSFPAGPSDDALKWAVRHAIGADAYDDPDSTSRVLSYITVASDASAGDAISAQEITNYNLLEALQDWGQYWGCDFTLSLRQTTGREHDLYFDAFPTRGADRTEGNSEGNRPVIFSDALGNISSARRFRELNNLRNAVVAKDTSAVETDASSISLYWRRESVSQEEDGENLGRELDKNALRIGREFGYIDHPQQMILDHFNVGDQVTTVHHHLGLSAEDTTLIEARFEIGENLHERKSLVFGEFEKTLPEQIQDTSGGGGGPSTKPKAALRYNLRADGGDLVPFSDPFPLLDAEVDISSDDETVIITAYAGENRLDLSVEGASYWDRDTGGSPAVLSPTEPTDDVMVGANIILDNSTGYARAARFEVGDADNFYGVLAGSLTMYSGTTSLILQSATAAMSMRAGTSVIMQTAGSNKWQVTSIGRLQPYADLTYQIGTGSLRVLHYYGQHVHLAAGGIIYHDDGDVAKPALVWDGAGYSPGTLSMDDLTDGHDAVTLSTTLDTNLLSLTDQELGLDTQSAHTVFAGPVSSTAAPEFRTLGADELDWDTNVTVDASVRIDGVDISAFVANYYNSHGHPVSSGVTGSTQPSLSGKTDTWSSYSTTYGFYPVRRSGSATTMSLLDWGAVTISLQQVYNTAGTPKMVVAWTVGGSGPTQTAGAIDKAEHTHNLSGGVADAAVASHTHGPGSLATGAPSSSYTVS